MATIQVGVRLDEEIVRKIDAIAEKTGSNRTDVMERCILLGLVEEQKFAGMGLAMRELAALLVSSPFRKVMESLSGAEVDPKQVAKLEHLRAARKRGRKPKSE